MFFLSLRFADSGELGNGTFSKCNKTHYYTFIHNGCKVPWALRGLSRGGVRSLRRPLLTKVKMSATFSMVSTSVRYCSAEHSLAEVGSENRIFHCLSTVLLQNSVDIDTAKAKEMCCFYNERFTLFCCVHTYQQRGLRFVPPFLRNVLRYVRTRRNIVKPIYMRSCNRFHSYESPHPPSGRVGDVVAMLQIEFLGISNHGIAEAAGFQRCKGVFLAPGLMSRKSTN